jgi:hypothetical protein
MWICHFAKLKRGLSKRPLKTLSLNYYFNAKIQQPRREGGQLYYGRPGSVAAHDYGEYPTFAIHCLARDFCHHYIFHSVIAIAEIHLCIP